MDLWGILVYLVRDPALGASQGERLQNINEDRDQWYKLHLGVHKLPRILLANCSNDGWADLHGPAFKATHTKATAI